MSEQSALFDVRFTFAVGVGEDAARVVCFYAICVWDKVGFYYGVMQKGVMFHYGV